MHLELLAFFTTYFAFKLVETQVEDEFSQINIALKVDILQKNLGRYVPDDKISVLLRADAFIFVLSTSQHHFSCYLRLLVKVNVQNILLARLRLCQKTHSLLE